MKSELLNLSGKQLSSMQLEVGATLRKGASLTLLAPTGSGKTLAFLIPLAEMLAARSEDKAVVLCPTRELARQNLEVWRSLYSGISASCLHGGRPVAEEASALRTGTTRMIFATPGRLADHLKRKNLQEPQVRILVIDEFDKCLELNFQKEMQYIVRQLRHVEQRVLVSATALHDLPDFIQTEGKKTFVQMDYLPTNEAHSARISQKVLRCSAAEKTTELLRLVSSLNGAPAIVFVTRREDVETLTEHLSQEQFAAVSYHGRLEQARRERNLFRFRAKCANILVTTDLAARGLDILQVRHVIHYHLPVIAEAYIHRTGRTARWTESGTTWLFLEGSEPLPDYAEKASETSIGCASILPVPPVWKALYIGRGKKAKLSKGDIVGWLCKKGGAVPADIGSIEIMPTASYVALKADKIEQILQRCKGEKIKGLRTIIEIMRK